MDFNVLRTKIFSNNSATFFSHKVIEIYLITKELFNSKNSNDRILYHKFGTFVSERSEQ